MAGKSEREAVQNFLRPLQQALSCITNKVLIHPGDYRLDIPYGLAVERFRLSSEQPLFLEIAIEYRIVKDERPDYGPYRINTLAYSYILSAEDGKEVFAYQWQPKSKVQSPHLHVTCLGRKYHFPTGRIAIEQVIRFLITEYKVKPRKERLQDWQEVLDQTQQRFERYRSWHFR